jgi:hypothetical protein
METMKWAAFIASGLLLASGAAWAGDYDWDDIFAPYRQRLDRATPTSGNAQNVNAATQVITPWPRNVHNRRIPGDGARMVGAVERYRNPLGASGGAPAPQAAGTPSAGAGGAQSNGANGAGQGGKAGDAGQSAQ